MVATLTTVVKFDTSSSLLDAVVDRVVTDNSAADVAVKIRTLL